MAGEFIIDASVIAAALFQEENSAKAREFLIEHDRLQAPTLLRAEIASVTAKKVWRGEASLTVGARAIQSLDDFVWRWSDMQELAEPAFRLAAEHQISAYDGLYLALARQEESRVVTLDAKLVSKAVVAGLGAHVEAL